MKVPLEWSERNCMPMTACTAVHIRVPCAYCQPPATALGNWCVPGVADVRIHYAVCLLHGFFVPRVLLCCVAAHADAPEFRQLMDIEAESAKFDPDGEFIRRWLPALARMPTQYIHAPWKAPSEVLAAADVELGVNYSYPIVEAAAAWEALQEAAAVVDASLEAAEQLEEGAGEVADATAAATAPLAVAAAGSGAGPGADLAASDSGRVSSGAQQQGSGQQQQRGRPHPFRPPTQPGPSLSLALLTAKEQVCACFVCYCSLFASCHSRGLTMSNPCCRQICSATECQSTPPLLADVLPSWLIHNTVQGNAGVCWH